METLLLPKFLLILIVTCVSPSSQKPSQSQDNPSKPDYLIEWDNYNKWLRNESSTVESDNGSDSHDPIVENTEKPIAVVLMEKPVEPSVKSAFISGAPGASNGTIVIIIEKEVILIPNEYERVSWLKHYDDGSHTKKDDIHKPSQDVDSSDGKPSTVDGSTNATKKNNGTHVPLNRTVIANESTHGNLSNYSKEHGNDTKDHKSSPKGHYILIDEDHPLMFSRNEKSNPKPGGNSTQKNATVGSNNPSHDLPKIEPSYRGIRWYPVPTDKPLHADTNSTGQKPSVIDKSSDATQTHNGTHVPLNETETVDNKTSEHQKAKSDHASIDKDDPHMHSSDGKSNSELGSNSTQKNTTTGSDNDKNGPKKTEHSHGVIRWYPTARIHKPLHADANSTDGNPSVIVESLNATEKDNGTHAPLNKTEISVNRTSEDKEKLLKGHKNDSKDHNSSPKSGHAPIDEDNPYVYSRKEKSHSKSGHNSTENAAAVTSDNDSDGLYEIKNNGDTAAISELNDPFDGNSNHTAEVHVID